MLVFLMFVQGGQTMIFSLPGSNTHKSMIVNAMGRKWELTFTTLVTFGGAFFASFPLFYATSFGGAYWLWTIILFSFIIQAVAYEYRSKPSNIFGQITFDTFLYINGSFGPVLIGVAVATFFTGSQFELNDLNQVRWTNPWRGLEALFNLRNLLLGFAVLFLAKTNGLLYMINVIANEEIHKRASKKLMFNFIVFLVLFLSFIISLLLSEGTAVNVVTGEISPEKYKYLHNFLQMPLVLILFLVGVVAVLAGAGIAIIKKSKKGIWFTGPGTFLTVFALFLAAGFNGTSFYPSTYDLQSSLTIFNASSSHFTLVTMMYVSFFIPVVFIYIWYAWKALDTKKITEGEMTAGGHVY
jgi:cytochrome d ubiquinol oxidase subunit II